MAKTTPVTPKFKDVDKDAAKRAQAAMAGGRQDPLTVPPGAKTTTDKNGRKYARWTERATITQAYRSVTRSGLMDVTVAVKLRQSAAKANNGRLVFSHFYINLGDDVPEVHVSMNDRSYGAIISLLVATKFMPSTGALKSSLLEKMFPPKGQPGASSPLANKAIIGNICQREEEQKDQKTKKAMLDEDGNPILQLRDAAESFLLDVAEEEEEEEESEGSDD